ncbi:MAG: Peptidase family protein [Flavipsychrobacter sp.]|nr:Peptidase family protein [Flavipsychrobacter sp.]
MTTRANVAVLKTIKDNHIRIDGRRSKVSNYYIQETVFEKGARIPVPLAHVVAEKPTIMLFADDEPLSNWAHPCRYLLHDAATGQLYKEVPAHLPPYAGTTDTPSSFVAFHVASSFPAISKYSVVDKIKFPIRYIYTGKRYAILYAGMSNNRHTNDLEFLYRTLVHVYGYTPANITVLNYNGTLNYDGNPHPVVHWPGDNTPYTMPVNGPGTKAALLNAIDALKTKLKAEDSLLIHTNNHGGGVPDYPESVIFCQPNWDTLTVTDFTNKLAQLPKYNTLMVMMEQCYSGGFNAPILAKSTAVNTSVASAADAYHTSAGGPEFDPFAQEWIAAMNGHDAYGHALAYNPDANHNGKVSAQEAFNYAKANDPADVPAHPVFNAKNAGADSWLGQDVFWVNLLSSAVLKQAIVKSWPPGDPGPRPEQMQEVVERLMPQLQELGAANNQQIDAFVKQHEQNITRLVSGLKLN